MISEAIVKIVNKHDLTYDEAYQAMKEIMGGKSTPTQNAAFLAALSTKSTKAETIDEIAGCAAAMRELATPVPHPGIETIDIVGTGGDGANTFNISTTAALISAAAGAKVTKHGNRAASSQCGTADCLEALGANISLSPEEAVDLLDKDNFTFLFAQRYHTAMRYVGPIRKELGFRTVFNILGPLTNPARPEYFLLGVYDEYLVEPIAHVLESLGVKRALVVYGRDKMDEVSLSAETAACELRDGEYHPMTLTPEEFGLTRCQKSDLLGATPPQNAEITRAILSGKEKGPKLEAALFNAACALYVCGVASSIGQGVEIARKQIDSGAAMKTLDTFVAGSQAFAKADADK
ncbi:anthranilate phosphoribosyltransferase [Bifidobacterium sp. ESL0745]|uniref:anthranilate phosphoribosyltransferase n=1 Tax=Bifidobacterium sp. ESL0745 TaxID=2983226 RepID=UPI0023F950A4|nr:anthranilate phosphoribosyltransferase [Bifidobacterium sp. ESL0745]MDF7665684.1 anthranilate phosphoribosyltransferase [Bifidobacterium sp. ESL0745]